MITYLSNFLIYGYYWFFLLLTIGLFVCLGLSIEAYRKNILQKKYIISGILLCSSLYFYLLHYQEDAFLKIHADEQLISAASKSFHETRSFKVPQLYSYAPFLKEITISSLDKRPPLFAFIGSLFHDFFGYEMENLIVLNQIIGILIIISIIAYGFIFKRIFPISISLLLLSAIMIFPMSVNSAGLEPLSILFVLAMELMGYFVLKKKPPSALILLFILVSFLCVYTRYEFGIFLFAAFLVIVDYFVTNKGKFSKSKWILLSPLLLVPFFLQTIVYKISPALLQKHGDEETLFSIQNIIPNLKALYDTNASISYSGVSSPIVIITLFATIALCLKSFRFRNLKNAFRSNPINRLFLYFSIAYILHFLFILSYSWPLDHLVIYRITLPFYILLIRAFIFFASKCTLTPKFKYAILLIHILFLFGHSIPKLNNESYRKIQANEYVFKIIKDFSDDFHTDKHIIISDSAAFFYLMDHSTVMTPYMSAVQENMKFDLQSETASSYYYYSIEVYNINTNKWEKSGLQRSDISEIKQFNFQASVIHTLYHEPFVRVQIYQIFFDETDETQVDSSKNLDVL